jgi:hypothetical protein
VLAKWLVHIVTRLHYTALSLVEVFDEVGGELCEAADRKGVLERVGEELVSFGSLHSGE